MQTPSTAIFTEVNKPNTSWASIVLKTLTKDQREEVELRHQQNQQEQFQQHIKKLQAQEQRNITLKREHRQHLIEQYGIHNSPFVQAGDLWFFFIEETEDDNIDAMIMRDNETNIWHLKNYLLRKYSINWLYDTCDTEDDCPVLSRWRKIDKILKNDRDMR